MIKKILKIIESWKLELILILTAIASYGISFVNPIGTTVGFHYSFRILLLVYLIRIFISIRHWRVSRGISVIHVFLNFQISSAVMAIGFTVLMYPGYGLLTSGAISGIRIFSIIIGIFLLIRWKKINKHAYWDNLKWNLTRALIASLICIILFYSMDMIAEFNIVPADS
jgi:hypothetical protein